MTSQRHANHVRYIKVDGHRLTRRERERLGLGNIVTKPRIPAPFPAHPERFLWFALTTLPKAEMAAAERLHAAGLATFCPVENVEMRASRRLKYRRVVRERSMLTSIILVGYPGVLHSRRIAGYTRIGPQGENIDVPARDVDVLKANVPWMQILEFPEITGVIGMDNSPVAVPLPNVLDLKRRSGTPGLTRDFAPMVGMVVEVVSGPFEGHHGKIIRLQHGAAELALFGLQGVLSAMSAPLTLPETWIDQVAS